MEEDGLKHWGDNSPTLFEKHVRSIIKSPVLG